MKSFSNKVCREIIRLNDYVVLLKVKNKEESTYYKSKIFKVYEYDNKNKLYKIKQVYPAVKPPPAYKDYKNWINYIDRHNRWDAARLKKLKIAKLLYGT